MYYLPETGLYLNYFRTYDPQTGRYIESDPVGLSAGQASTYAYVGDQPVTWGDPLGLCKARPKKRCLPNVGNFVNMHLADAQQLSEELPAGTTPQEILAVSANETGYGNGFANVGNFFGIHASRSAFAGQTGVYITPSGVRVAEFSTATGYLNSGQVFVNTELPYLTGQNATNPENFFNIIHQHGYGTGTPSYVSTLMQVFNLIGNCL
jgi:RHS repeat-associated protein